MQSPAVFLDRDGTINYDQGYTHKISEFEFLDGVVDALSHMSEAGYLLFVVTNQSGVAKGYYTMEDVNVLHEWVAERLSQYSISITDFLVCPHHPDFTGACACRKPGNLLIEKAIIRRRIDRANSWMIGDRVSDYEAAKSSLLRFIGVKNKLHLEEFPYEVPTVSDLTAAWRLIAQGNQYHS